tara:strand:+ start:961 stop:4113 length:3153 start_codon:yes stop_codon:yes gene_type:complete
MAAVSQATTTLLGGISQQPDPNKLPGQVRDAVNVQLNPTFGCEKRPASKFKEVLANDIPATNVKWFDIFRDSIEKYVACIYRASGSTRVRVWDCETGVERTVTINAASQDYLDGDDPTNYRHLTISEYTLITNPDQNVTMNSATDEEQNDVALAVVNQIAYNTTYNINFLKDGQEATPVKVYSAATLSVRPSTFTEFDDGACSKAANQQYVEAVGTKTGLSFDLTTICQPTQFPVRLRNKSYPTSMVYAGGDVNGVARSYLGKAQPFGNGSYGYFTQQCPRNGPFGGSVTLRVEVRATGIEYAKSGDNKGEPVSDGSWAYSGVSIVSYNQSKSYATGMQFVFPGGLYFNVQDIRTPDDTIEYDFKSVYRTSVRMRNGGVNWRVGDEVTVQMAGKSYTVRVETETFGYGFLSEASVSYTTQSSTASGGTLDVADIVGALTTSINAIGNYTAEPIGNVIHIERTDGKKFNIQAVGGTTERAIYAIKGTVNDVSLLPIQGKDGTILLVRNTVDSTADDYYVRFTTSEGDIPGQGSWEETVKPGIPTTMNPTSLPQALIRNADGNFTLRPLSPSLDITPDGRASWVGRQVGDIESNPSPSFVGRGIANMFFYMNRLGFLCEDKVIMSQPGSYFDFFVGSAIAVSDADPIDMVAASERPSFLKAAISVPRGVLLFAENTQYILSTQEVAFGPSTANITKISDYSFDSKIEPLETGVSLMFHTESATYSKVFEMAIPNVDAARPQVAELTRIIPEYIPPSLNWSASNPNNNQVFFGQGDNVAYNFSFFNVGNERSMSGWTKWVFDYNISHLAYFQDRAYLVQYNPQTTSYLLSTMDMLDNPGDSSISVAGREFTPRLDALVPKSRCTLVEINEKETEVTIPSGLTVYDSIAEKFKDITVIFGDLGSATTFQDRELTSNKFIIQTEDAELNFSVGFSYPMSVELPSFYVMNDKDADRNNVPIIENVQTYLYLSGRYEAKLARLGYQDRYIDLEVNRADVYIADSSPITEVGVSEIPLFCKGDLATVSITSTSPLPSAVTGYGWEGHYSNRGIKNLKR